MVSGDTCKDEKKRPYLSNQFPNLEIESLALGIRYTGTSLLTGRGMEQILALPKYYLERYFRGNKRAVKPFRLSLSLGV